MISQTAEYALRAIVYLADQDETPHTTSQIAEATQVPAGYLSKVMQTMSRAGLVHSQRGLNGGFTLAHYPEELTVFDVISAVDPLKRIRQCPLRNKAHGKNLCPLHRRIDEAIAAVEESFRATTVDELLETPRRRKQSCRFPDARVSAT